MKTFHYYFIDIDRYLKLQPATRFNIIELMQVTQQNYASSEKVELPDLHKHTLENKHFTPADVKCTLIGDKRGESCQNCTLDAKRIEPCRNAHSSHINTKFDVYALAAYKSKLDACKNKSFSDAHFAGSSRKRTDLKNFEEKCKNYALEKRECKNLDRDKGSDLKSILDSKSAGSSKSYSNFCAKSESCANDEEFTENCAECVKNNFWMNKSVLNKSADMGNG